MSSASKGQRLRTWSIRFCPSGMETQDELYWLLSHWTKTLNVMCLLLMSLSSQTVAGSQAVDIEHGICWCLFFHWLETEKNSVCLLLSLWMGGSEQGVSVEMVHSYQCNSFALSKHTVRPVSLKFYQCISHFPKPPEYWNMSKHDGKICMHLFVWYQMNLS